MIVPLSSLQNRLRSQVLTATTSRRPTTQICLSLLLVVGVIIRLYLSPITEGWDFQTYERLVYLAVHGHDVYGPQSSKSVMMWAYPPLFLNVFVALSWVTSHTGIPLRLLGKLPTILADIGLSILIFRGLRRRGMAESVAFIGVIAYLFNPLVIYNGAFVGRFDAVALVFLLLALENYDNRWFAPAYAFAIAVKTFPLFLLPLLLFGRDRQSPRRLLMSGLYLIPLCLPYVLTNPGGLIYNVTSDATLKTLGRLSWYTALVGPLSWQQVLSLSHLGVLVYPLLILLLIRQSLYVKTAGALALFFVLNRTVYEQYLLWPLPFLIILALGERNRIAMWLAVMITAAGMLENEQTWSPLDVGLRYSVLPAPWWPLNLALALSVALFLGLHVRANDPSKAWRRRYHRRRTSGWIRTAAGHLS